MDASLLRLENELLAEDLTEFAQAQRDVAAARSATDSRERRLVAALGADSIQLDTLPALREAVDTARNELGVATDTLDRLWWRIDERLRRIERLQDQVERGAERVRENLPLQGRWRVTMRSGSPSDQGATLNGTFLLRQRGTEITGTYTFGNGTSGSLEGTFVDRKLRLERVDSVRGFDRIFQAEMSNSGDSLEGTWQPTILSDGGPGGGTWTAARPIEETLEDSTP